MSRNDRVLARLRIAVGALFLVFGEYKIVGSEFLHGGFAGSPTNRRVADRRVGGLTVWSPRR
jgi:hypothetical protein